MSRVFSSDGAVRRRSEGLAHWVFPSDGAVRRRSEGLVRSLTHETLGSSLRSSEGNNCFLKALASSPRKRIILHLIAFELCYLSKYRIAL